MPLKNIISSPQIKNKKCIIHLLNLIISVFLITGCGDSDKQNENDCEDYKRNTELYGYWECVTPAEDADSLLQSLFDGSNDSCTSESLYCSLKSHFHFTDWSFDSSDSRMKCYTECDSVDVLTHPMSVRGYRVGYWFTIDDSLFLSYEYDCFGACSKADYSGLEDDYSITGTEVVAPEVDSSSDQSCKSKCKVSSYKIENDTLSLIANGDTIKYRKVPDL